ncbi:glycosyltransferase (plasmid) [Kitasatospora sp. NBC_00374]|uniref:glycosyltransferase family 2 protein n=1 Tax=Kitasatospora sp. NBC_00374 TaxID=2975964 RepID=UPI002F9196F5
MTGEGEGAVELSVVVTTRERAQGCRQLVRAVREQCAAAALAYEIVLVFDGCEPYGWVEDGDPDLRTVVLPEQVGIARARNTGIGESRGQLLAFLDDDCVPAGTWLAELRRLSRAHPAKSAFGGPVIGTDSVNLYAQLRDAVYYYETFGSWYVTAAAGADVMGAPYVNGGNSAYRREAITRAGGFDALLPAYSDVELGRRMRLQQHAVLSPGMAIHHDHPSAFRAYMLRCWRSGKARALLWAHRGYPQDRPSAVARAVVSNIVWNNAVHRRRRVIAPPTRVVAVLLCQEVVHGFGYAYALLGCLAGGGRRVRAGSVPATGLGVAPGAPQ